MEEPIRAGMRAIVLRDEMVMAGECHVTKQKRIKCEFDLINPYSSLVLQVHWVLAESGNQNKWNCNRLKNDL